MEEDICRSITAQRLAGAINGYTARGAVASISDRRGGKRRSETDATIKVIYGEGCRLGEGRLKREGVVFKQIPYAIKVS